MKKNRNKLIIDNLIEDRILLLIFAPLITTVVGGLVYFLHTWKARSTLETAAKYLLFDIFLAFFLFSFICFLWSIFGPDKVNKFLFISYSKAVLLSMLVSHKA
jgi:hypothetical protein